MSRQLLLNLTPLLQLQLLLLLLISSTSCQRPHWPAGPADSTLNGLTTPSEQAVPAVSPLPLYESHWPREQLLLGPVSAVAVTASGNPILLHRGNTTWSSESFDELSRYNLRAGGPIETAVLLTLDRTTGSIIRREGSSRFYMPHGLHIDAKGNRWITDVALHQVFKLAPDKDTPLIKLGVAFEPGFDHSHFCQPTDVVVAEDGTVFVADGYCNSRVVALQSDGTYLTSFGRNYGLNFMVPHSLAMVKSDICVADRENGRIVCWDMNETFLDPRVVDLSSFGRIFSLAITGDIMFSVHQGVEEATGLATDAQTGIVLNTWGMTLATPHSIAASADNSALYVAELEPPRVSKFLLAPSFHENAEHVEHGQQEVI